MIAVSPRWDTSRQLTTAPTGRRSPGSAGPSWPGRCGRGTAAGRPASRRPSRSDGRSALAACPSRPSPPAPCTRWPAVREGQLEDVQDIEPLAPAQSPCRGRRGAAISNNSLILKLISSGKSAAASHETPEPGDAALGAGGLLPARRSRPPTLARRSSRVSVAQAAKPLAKSAPTRMALRHCLHGGGDRRVDLLGDDPVDPLLDSAGGVAESAGRAG
jgi:hypothetical protein